MDRRTLAALLLLAALNGCSLFLPSGEPDGFVRVQGTQFVLHERPYYFAGANLWYGCYLGSPGATGDRERLIRELDVLSAHGLVNLRVLAASEDSYLKRSVKPAIQRRPGELDEDLLQGLDFLLAEMAKRRMKAVLYLNNYWEWSGGMATYNSWTGRPGFDPEDPAAGWELFMNFSASFYTDTLANAMFRDYIRTLVMRRNTVNGRFYRDDPVIMAWQLANEPRPGREGEFAEQNVPAFIRWLDETAGFLQTLDTNHLVSTGSEGTVGTLGNSEYFLASHRSAHIDYLTVHLWPLNWGWFDPQKIPETLPRTEHNALSYIRLHMSLARSLNRPMVMEEFGLGRDGGGFLPGTPTTARDRYYALLFSTLEDSARVGGPLVGSNIWAWGGEGRAHHPDGMWRPGDPFVGDPPQEPQGRNSVFVQDTSTLRILRDHAFRMMRVAESTASQ
jgi:mannan endo-1,4-beta-mannosidase